jgi:SAM-dependent methyltransferase
MSGAAAKVGVVVVDTGRSGTGRQALVWPLLVDALASVGRPGERPSVLDCGGGSGGFAVPLAEAGAQVTVVDVSADALATLRRRAAEAGVAGSVEAVQGEVESLPAPVHGSVFDLVLAHGILEAVDEPAAAFESISRTLRPGGLLSVLVANPVAAVLARTLAGELVAALAELRALEDNDDGSGPQVVCEMCTAAGLVVEAVHGIGVFAEFVPGPSLDLPGARVALAELEAAAAVRAPFADIASRVHVLARRPNG